MAAPPGQGRGPTDPPWPSLYSSSKPRRSACRIFIDTSEPPASLSLATLSNSNSERRKRQNEGVKLRLRALHVIRLQEATNNTQRGGHNEGHGAVSTSITVLMSSFLLHRNNSEVGGVMIECEFRSTLTKDSFALKSPWPG